MNSRTFTVIGGNGIYKSSSGPITAARKAARQLLQKSNRKEITFTLRETTSGSNKKEYKYHAIHKALSPSHYIDIGKTDKEGNPIVIKNKYIVKKII
jgi:3-dehydroquinate dehydratase